MRRATLAAVLIVLGLLGAGVGQACPSGYTATRLGGTDRIDTSILISREGHPSPSRASAAVIARADDFADSLGGARLAVNKFGPLLLNPPSELDDRVRDELLRVLRPGQRVYLLGGEAALSKQVADDIAAFGYQVERVAGADRYETSVEVAHAMGDPDNVLLATGRNFPDGLVAAASAHAVGGTVLLTDGSSLPPVVARYIENIAEEVITIGDPAAGAYPDAEVVAGTDRYDTAVRAAVRFYGEFPVGQIGVATGENFPDALAGAALIRHGTGPLLLTEQDYIRDEPLEIVRRHLGSLQAVYIYGQEDVVSGAVERQINEVIVVACGP